MANTNSLNGTKDTKRWTQKLEWRHPIGWFDTKTRMTKEIEITDE